jgi:hypothetical protein
MEMKPESMEQIKSRDFLDSTNGFEGVVLSWEIHQRKLDVTINV